MWGAGTRVRPPFRSPQGALQTRPLSCVTPHPHPTAKPFLRPEPCPVFSRVRMGEGASGAYLYQGTQIPGFSCAHIGYFGIWVLTSGGVWGHNQGVGSFPARRVTPAETLKGVESMRLTPSAATVAIVGAFVAFVLLPLLAAFVEGVLS